MPITLHHTDCSGVKLVAVNEKKQQIGWAYLYLLYNDQHQRPFGLMEDVFVVEKFRGKGVGTALIRKLIQLARNKECYKLIATSRSQRQQLHQFYQKLGFTDYGKEFRIDFAR